MTLGSIAPILQGMGMSEQQLVNAITIYERKQYAMAATMFSQIDLDLLPKRDAADALCRWGHCLSEQDDLDAAREKVDEARELLPDADFVHVYSGDFCADSDEPLEAIREYRKALTLNNHSAEAHYSLARVFHSIRRISRTLKHLHRAIELNPDYFEAYELLGDVHWEQDDFAAAHRAYKHWADRDPMNAQAMMKLANAVASHPNMDSARALPCYDRAAEIEVDAETGAMVYANWGKVLRDVGRPREAIEKLKIAYEMDPDLTYALETWAACLIDLGACEAALEQIENAHAHAENLREPGQFEDRSYACYIHALALHRLGRNTEAVDLLVEGVRHGYVSEDILTGIREFRGRHRRWNKLWSLTVRGTWHRHDMLFTRIALVAAHSLRSALAYLTELEDPEEVGKLEIVRNALERRGVSLNDGVYEYSPRQIEH